jgi:hypothetical protein
MLVVWRDQIHTSMKIFCMHFFPNRILWKIPLFRDVKMKLTCINDGFWLLGRKMKIWLTRNQNNVSEWSDMSTCGLLFQWASTIKFQLGTTIPQIEANHLCAKVWLTRTNHTETSCLYIEWLLLRAKWQNFHLSWWQVTFKWDDDVLLIRPKHFAVILGCGSVVCL